MPNVAHVSRAQKKMEKAAFKSEKKEIKAQTAALVVEQTQKSGVHNCPSKDAGTTHAFRARCLKLQHAGYCPACGNIVSYKHGCKEHSVKADALLETYPEREDRKKYREDHGIEAEPPAEKEKSTEDLQSEDEGEGEGEGEDEATGKKK